MEWSSFRIGLGLGLQVLNGDIVYTVSGGNGRVF